MSIQRPITRRQMLGAALAGTAGVIGGTVLQGNEHQAGLSPNAATADPKIRGPFPILSTPFTASGAVDFGTLANQARFVDWCGCPGMIWPQSGNSVDLLTADEKLQGMDVLAQTARGLRTALCLGVQGKDTAEMLLFAKHAENWRRRRSSRGHRTRAGRKTTCVSTGVRWRPSRSGPRSSRPPAASRTRGQSPRYSS